MGKMAAVNKAVELLESLQSQVLKEGEEEAATYNKFSCFCKDTTTDKLDSIQKGEDGKYTLLGEMETLTSKRDGLDTSIEGFLEDIKTLEKDMKDATKERKKTKKVYNGDTADLAAALEALKGAIKSLKSAKGSSFLQLRAMSEGVQQATLLADALGFGIASVARAVEFLQAAPDVPTEDYKFKSGDIIGTLEGLEKDFRTKKVTVDEDEVKSVQAHDSLMQEK